jgi:hypothetical protein
MNLMPRTPLLVPQELAQACIVKEQTAVFIDDDEGRRAEFQHFAELSLVFGDLRLRPKGGV